MFERMQAWLTSPDLGDEDQNRLARYLHSILLAGIVLLLLYITAKVATGSQLFASSHRVLMGLILFLTWLLYLLRQHYLRQASVLVLAGIWVVFTFLAWNADGIRDTAMVAQVLGVLIASLLLGWRAAAVVAALSILTALSLTYAENTALIAPSPDEPLDSALELSFIFILVVILNRLLINTLSKTLDRVKKSNQELQIFSNNLESQVVERTQAAEQARMQAEAARREAETARQLIETQMWFTTGQAELNDLTRGEQTVEVVAQRVIQYLCHYLDVPLGVLFVREGDTLVSMGHFASSFPHGRQPFRLGEGLVGEVALSQRVMLVDQVPADYVVLPTSIGELSPHKLFLHPLVYDNTVLGVVELGVMGKWTPRQSGFVNSVAQSIAIALHTAQTRERINELLLETQMQAEELQAQEEELRAANEEWEAQVESLRAAVIGWQQKKEALETMIRDLQEQNKLLARQG